jgi:hypothetical protein
MAKHNDAGKQKPNGNGLEHLLWPAVDKLRENIAAATAFFSTMLEEI